MRFRDGRRFYLAGFVSVACAAAVVLIPHAPLLAMTIAVNVVATLLMPPALSFLLLLVNDREVVGELCNTRWANVAGVTVVVAISPIGMAYGLITAFPSGCRMSEPEGPRSPRPRHFERAKLGRGTVVLLTVLRAYVAISAPIALRSPTAYGSASYGSAGV